MGVGMPTQSLTSRQASSGSFYFQRSSTQRRTRQSTAGAWTHASFLELRKAMANAPDPRRKRARCAVADAGTDDEQD